MAQKKFDGVIESVRYTPEGKIETVRLYERRGPTYSDRLLLARADLLQRLRSGKKFAVGSRKLYISSTFEIKAEVKLSGPRGQEAIVAGGAAAAERDLLQGALLY